MADALKAAVGIATGGKRVPNNKDDVLYVRKLLIANKYRVSETGAMGPDILKALKAAAEDHKLFTGVALIEPNCPLMKKLKPALLKAEAKPDGPPAKGEKTVPAVGLKIGGKVQQIPQVVFDKGVEQIFGKLGGYINALVSGQATNSKIVTEYQKAQDVRTGFWMATAHVLTVKAGGIKPIDTGLTSNADKSVGELSRAFKSKNIAKLHIWLPIAERQVAALNRDINRFLKEFNGTAGTMATSFSVASAVGFAVVGAMAAPIAVAGGMSVSAAAVATAAGTKMMNTAATDLGRAVSGEKVTLMEAARNVSVDGLVSAATAGIGNKIPLKWVQTMAGKIAPSLASKVPFLSQKALTPYLTKFMTTTGEETVKSAVGESLEILGGIAKSGTVPKAADFEAAAKKILITTLTAGIVGKLKDYEKLGAAQMRHEAEVTLLPDVLSGLLGKKNTLSKKQQVDLFTEVSGKIYEEMMKFGTDKALSAASGSEPAKKLAEMASAHAVKAPAIRKIAVKEMEAAMKRRKIDTQASRGAQS